MSIEHARTVLAAAKLSVIQAEAVLQVTPPPLQHSLCNTRFLELAVFTFCRMSVVAAVRVLLWLPYECCYGAVRVLLRLQEIKFDEHRCALCRKLARVAAPIAFKLLGGVLPEFGSPVRIKSPSKLALVSPIAIEFADFRVSRPVCQPRSYSCVCCRRCALMKLQPKKCCCNLRGRATVQC